MKSKFKYLLILLLPGFLASCTKENVETFSSEVIKQWTVQLAAKNVLDAPAGLVDTGFVNFQLFSDNSIRYELTVKNISNGDVLSGARLVAGDPVTNGNVVVNLTPTSKFAATLGANTFAYGVFTGLRQSLVDSLLNDNTDLYFELLSVQHPNGYARGQLNMRIDFAADINLSGSEEVPAVNTTAEGKAWLRITSGKKLYSRITITNNEPNDPFVMAHIHRAAIGQNGPVIFTLANSAADFNVSKVYTIDQATYGTIINDSRLYVNAHSQLYPAGKIRGQIRN